MQSKYFYTFRTFPTSVNDEKWEYYSSQTGRSDSHGFQISDQFFDFVFFFHESSDQSQTLLRDAQSVGGASLHNSCLLLMSAGRTDRKQ